jgi:hypothetical protein
MADGFAIAVLVEVRLYVVLWDGEVLVKEAEEVSFRLWLSVGGFGCVVLEGEEFDAVAGGEYEAFTDAGLVEEGAGCIGEARRGDGEALADLDGRGVVVDAEEDETSLCLLVHGAVNL